MTYSAFVFRKIRARSMARVIRSLCSILRETRSKTTWREDNKKRCEEERGRERERDMQRERHATKKKLDFQVNTAYLVEVLRNGVQPKNVICLALQRRVL